MSPLDESITGRWHFSFVLNGTKPFFPISRLVALGVTLKCSHVECTRDMYCIVSILGGGDPGVTGNLCVFEEKSERA